MADIVTLANPGLIPMEAVTTMGVSAKEGENPIGFFGTGLKYAIAGLLRTSHRITIWRGLDRHDFATEKAEVRGKEFDFIRMTGPEGSQQLGFTTHLGAQWETWQVFRELYSNCLDESGDLSFTAVEPREGWTTIRVTGVAFAEAARQRAKYFLASTPIWADADVEVHPGQSSGIYYRGVLVGAFPVPAAFTYNLIGSQSLTEDRTLKYLFMADHYVQAALAKCEDREFLRKVLLKVEGREAKLSFSEPGEAFAETALELAELHGVTAVLPGAVAAAEVWAQRNARVRPLALNPREERDLAEAKAFLNRIGYPITAPVVVTETLGPGVAGMAKHGTIYLARLAINRGGNYLIGTLLEEQLHLSHGFLDESRTFQDFLLDLVVKFARDAYGAVAPEPPPQPEPVLEEVLF
jgi:hypothetical protein